mgnify:CR=1 FL=1
MPYPNDEDGQVLQSLADAGNDMEKPMDIDFQIAAHSEEVAVQVAEQAAERGYEVAIYFDEGEDDADDDPLPPYTCECTKTMVPTYEAVMAAQRELAALAEPLGAMVDGWGTFGNAVDEEE